MSGTIQPLQDIKPMAANSDAAKKSSPEQEEYEEGKRFLENGDFGQAAGALHGALLAFEQKNDTNGIANASNQLGTLCLRKGDFEKALTHYQRSFDICDAENDRMSVIAVLQNRVEAYVGLKQYDKAVEDCLIMLDFHHDYRNPQGAVAVLEQMAEVYIDAGDTAKAADSYRTIASIHANYKHQNIAQRFLEKADALEEKAA